MSYLKELDDQILECKKCKLTINRYGYPVPGYGDAMSPFMIVGEAPGEWEANDGIPFTGRSGVILRSALVTAGIPPEHTYMTNTVLCRPYDREGGRYRNRPPEASEINMCNYWLLKKIKLIQPEIIVCVGGVAAKAIIDPLFKILISRGLITEPKLIPPDLINSDHYKVFGRSLPLAMATLHPAYIIRKSGEEYDALYKQLVEDLKLAKEKCLEVLDTGKSYKEKVC
jgi:DNA polymerase